MTNNQEPLQENIEALGRVFKDHPSVSQAVMASIKTKTPVPPTPSKLNTLWSLIMKKQSRQFAIAAITVILVGLTVWQLGGSFEGRVYAMSDVPDLFRSARTFHMKAHAYFPKGDGSGTLSSAQSEIWLDLENQRWKTITPIINGSTVTIKEEVYDGGDFALKLDRESKTATYERVTPYRRARKLRQGVDALLQFSFGDPRLFDKYQSAGQEKIEGKLYDIWQLDMNEGGMGVSVNQGGMMMRLRSWFSPKTGEIFKSEISTKPSKNAPWVKKAEVTLIERDIPIDESVFTQTVPQGYTENTIDTPPPAGTGGSRGSLKLHAYFLFQLGDDSTILCWKSEDKKSDKDPVRLLEGINAGDPFPEFPVVVTGLQRSGQDKKGLLDGHYLAHSVYGSDIYIWGLYVPGDIQEPEIVPSQYKLQHETYVAGKKFKSRIGMSAEMIVENQSDFATFILGAMADLSDPGAELPDLTYDGTLKLAEKIRSGLHR